MTSTVAVLWKGTLIFTKHLALCSSTHWFRPAIQSVRGKTIIFHVCFSGIFPEWFRENATSSLKLVSVSYQPSLV